jgi:NADPH:quinone reductase-like Zn-dependent oxidoreductase
MRGGRRHRAFIAGGNGAISYGDGLRALAKLADQGKYTVQVTKTFPLAEATQAQQLVHTSDAIGKVVLIVDEAKARTR